MKVLVIGASGMFGDQMARELLRRGHSVRAVQRPGGTPLAERGFDVVTADALDERSMVAAAVGCDAIVFGFHVPYHRWHRSAERAAQAAAAASAATGASVLFPGNVYGLGPDFSAPLQEDAPRTALCALGAIRNRMEESLRQACDRGGRAIVLRAGDYIGPDTPNSWLTTMTVRARKGGPIFVPAPDGVPHAWAYLPDVVRAGVDLLERRATLAAFEEVNFEGYVLPQEAMVSAVREALGDPERPVRRVPWGLVRMVGLIVPLVGKVVQMSYLWRVPLRLDGRKLRRLLPDFEMTPLPLALRASLGVCDRGGAC